MTSMGPPWNRSHSYIGIHEGIARGTCSGTWFGMNYPYLFSCLASPPRYPVHGDPDPRDAPVFRTAMARVPSLSTRATRIMHLLLSSGCSPLRTADSRYTSLSDHDSKRALANSDGWHASAAATPDPRIFAIMTNTPLSPTARQLEHNVIDNQ